LLNDLFVLPSHRRRGIGSELLHAAIDYGRAMDAVRISLTTDVANATAQATYESQGWQRDQAFYTCHFLPAGS
jgi:ribosomal protein S18 acetylase RimI-like enzyme